MRLLARRIESLECRIGFAGDFPTIREAAARCPDERSRRAALAFASRLAILDVKWIGEGRGSSRTLADVVEDVAVTRVTKELGVNGDERFWAFGFCVFLYKVLDVGCDDHASSLREVEELAGLFGREEKIEV